MEKQKFRITCKCDCGNVFKLITKNKDVTAARCSMCKAKKRMTRLVRMGDGPVSDADLIQEKAIKKLMETPEFQQRLLSKLMSPTPETSRNNIKAVDATADIVMQDYKIGDLPDRGLRTGDTMTPKLPPAQQAQADNFFGGGKKNSNGAFNAANIRRMVNSGSLKPEANGAINPIARTHAARVKPPVRIIASTDGKS